MSSKSVTNKSINELLIHTLCYALFKKKLLNDKEIIGKLQTNAFGVFTTIKRTQKLKKWPEDIHGCIGYWGPQYNKLNRVELYEHLLRVSYDAVWTDDRRQYFKPIETDPLSTMEIDFMMNPIYEINVETGFITKLNEQFTNNKYGIIIESIDGRATYLPYVFQNISWQELIQSIKDKAGINSDNFQVFAYKVKQIKIHLISLLKNNLFSYMNVLKFTRLLIDNMNPELEYPFIYGMENNNFFWDSEDDVRNVGLLGDVIKYYHRLPNIITKSEYAILMKKIIHILSNIDNYSAQGVAFLSNIYSSKHNNSNNIKLLQNREQYCHKLFDTLQTTNDYDFEFPQIVIGLTNANCDFKVDLRYLTFTYGDNIFKMNWVIQALIKLKKVLKRELVVILIRKINNTILKDVDDVETNFIAVAFEALCFIYSYLQNTVSNNSNRNSNGNSNGNSNSNNKKAVLFKIFELLFILENRKNADNLYTFLDKTASTDITGHIINGYFELLT